jgi:CHAT domain-containing protein
MHRFLLFILTVFFFAGCSKQLTPEQLAADRVLSDARAALGKGNYEEARGRFAAALAMDENLGRSALVAEELRELARIHAGRANYDSAYLYYSRASQQYHGLADRGSVRNLTIETAALHRLQGQERQAFTELEEALRLARVFGDSAGVRDIEMAILPSCRLLDIRDIEAQAVNDLLKAYAAASEAGKLAVVYYEVGLTQLFRREYSRAAEHFLRAYTLSEQAHDSVRAAESLLRVGVAFDWAGRTTEAFQSYSDAIKLADRLPTAPRIRIEILTRVGNAYLKGRQVDQAKRFYNAALTSAIRSGNKLAENYLALQLALTDLDRNTGRAIQSCKTVADYFSTEGYPRGISYALLCYGAALERANRMNEAAQAYKSALEYLEGMYALHKDDFYADCEGTFFGQRRGTAYDELLDVLLRTGQNDQAFFVAQRKRSWEVRQMYGIQELRHTSGSTAPLLQSLDEAISARVGAEEQMALILERNAQDRSLTGAVRGALEKSAATVAGRVEDVVRANPVDKPYLKIAPATLPDLQRRIGTGRALVWYVPGKRSLYTFVLTPSRISVQLAAIERDRLYAVAGDLDLALRRAEAHGDSISKIAAIPDSRTLETFRKLYEAFIRPIDNDIALATHLLLVLPQDLSFVPLHAFRRTQLPGSPYLAEQRFMSYVPGAEWLYEKGQEIGGLKDVVGLGYAGTTGWDVEYELRDIRAFYKEARLYFGQRASMASLQGEKGDILHLAVEVRYSDHDPWNSAVVLSDGKSLTTRTSILLGDLRMLPRFPVVVLSNLSSGQPNTPVIMAPLFLSNGARMVVTNTYTPSRKLKKFFGEIFYTALLAGATPEQAFRKAQQDLIRNPEFSSPLVWSSLFLWGQ